MITPTIIVLLLLTPVIVTYLLGASWTIVLPTEKRVLGAWTSVCVFCYWSWG